VTGADWPGELTDGTVTIRTLVRADAPAFAQAFVDDPTLGVMLGLEEDWTVEDVEAKELAGDGRPLPALAIAEATTREFLGGIGLYRVDERHRRGEIGFWLTPQARGRGAARRAIRLLTSWAFGALGFERMELTTTPDNAASRMLALKLGFTEEGTMRARNLERGRRVDVMMFAVLKDEWRG
jgi:RimJ/RimL family protein N-acetyltransferase